ncbi:MAG TPA: hypothetical protein VIM76_00780 [Candidatus Dormibacteraeota bacterium]
MVASSPFFRRSAGFKIREHLVMGVATLEMKTKLEACGREQAFQGRKGWLPQIALVRRDHRRRDPGSLAELLLSKAGLQPREGED